MKVQKKNQTPTQKIKKTVDFKVKYKTQKCKYWTQHGYCPFNEMCAFAHDDFEIRNKSSIHSRYKTKICLNFSKYGWCKYGDRCLFLHIEEENQIKNTERTRSNSPASNIEDQKEILHSNKHSSNLKILNDFGFEIFEVHMKKKNSVLIPLMQEVLNPERQNVKDSLIFKQTTKKPRMYSL